MFKILMFCEKNPGSPHQHYNLDISINDVIAVLLESNIARNI